MDDETTTSNLESQEVVPVASVFPAPDTSVILQLVQQGEEPKRIFAAITETAAQMANCRGAALYLPSDEDASIVAMVHSDGDFIPEDELGLKPDHSRRIIAPELALHTQLNRYGDDCYYSIPIIHLGTPIGSLVVHSSDEIPDDFLTSAMLLAYHAGTVFERQKLTGTVQHFLDRLQVLNQLNGLIASNAGVSSTVKSVSRESAFRFAADISLTLLLSEDKAALDVLRGAAYGCAPQSIPARFSLNAGLMLTQIIQLGGHFSVPSLSEREGHGLRFLQDLGVVAIDAQCLEVRGEPLGILLIGYKREMNISRQELNAFQEFSQAAAVAIANARAQERIASYTDRLEELVDSRTAELEHQTALAEEANKAKSQFLANMSHELRTPLTAIIGYSSVLKDGIFGPLNDKQTDALSAITRSSEHLKNLIDDVLNLARVESGKETPEPKVIALNEMLLHLYKLMMQPALNKGLNLEQPKLPKELLKVAVYADHKHTQQILINMLSNGVKYTPRGGRVWVSVDVIADKVRISVHDTGVGIPPAKQASLFERFERGDDAYSKGQEGTGIGLNLTKHLVEINGGRIGVESVIGEGSRFWVMLPAADIDIQASIQEEEVTHHTVKLAGLTTLIVDDNIDTCTVLRTILEAAGASVRLAHTVREAVASLEEGHPDIVLTDLALPQESGINLIQHIRGNKRDGGELPIIVLSACAFQADRDAAMNAGASTFIPKPFRPGEILKTVRELTLQRALSS